MMGRSTVFTARPYVCFSKVHLTVLYSVELTST